MSCGALSQDLVLPCNGNQPGVFAFYITEFINLAGVTVSANSATTITMSASTHFYIFPVRRGANTSILTQTTEINLANGVNFYQQEIDYTFPKLSPTAQGVFQQLSQNDVIIIVLDLNGNYWLLGSNHGMSLTAGSASTGKGPSDLNGYTVKIVGQESYPMLAIAGSLVTPLLA